VFYLASTIVIIDEVEIEVVVNKRFVTFFGGHFLGLIGVCRLFGFGIAIASDYVFFTITFLDLHATVAKVGGLVNFNGSGGGHCVATDKIPCSVIGVVLDN